MFNYKKTFLIFSAACCVQLMAAQEYVPKLIIKNMTGTALTVSNASGYLDLELPDGGWVHDKAFSAGDLVCQPGDTLIFESLPGRLECGDTCFLSPEIYQKWVADKVRLWGGIRIFLSEPDVRPIVSAQFLKKAVDARQDMVVYIKREKWFKSVYKLRKPSRHYRVSGVEPVDQHCKHTKRK